MHLLIFCRVFALFHYAHLLHILYHSLLSCPVPPHAPAAQSVRAPGKHRYAGLPPPPASPRLPLAALVEIAKYRVAYTSIELYRTMRATKTAA